jgi:F0F1-type ATP synthase alpha subunit
MQNDFFDSIPVEDINRATQSLREYMETQGSDACELIYNTGKLEEDTEQKLRGAVEDWKRAFS